MGFEEEKKGYLKKLYKPDRSKKTEVDEEIKFLIDKINSFDDYYTTSSCAGRILMITVADKNRKDMSKWLFSSHKKIKFENLPFKDLPKETIYFRQEAMILHVACKSVESAQSIIDKAKYAGFKRSGIMATKKRVMVEICSTEKIDAPIAKDGKLLVDNTYLRFLVSEANRKMKQNEVKMKKFYELLNS
jgi:tRNA wybutosine-synthesizing protein 3